MVRKNDRDEEDEEDWYREHCELYSTGIGTFDIRRKPLSDRELMDSLFRGVPNSVFGVGEKIWRRRRDSHL